MKRIYFFMSDIFKRRQLKKQILDQHRNIEWITRDSFISDEIKAQLIFECLKKISEHKSEISRTVKNHLALR